MYIYFYFAYINNVLYIVIIAYVIIIFPLLLNIHVILSGEQKKLYFALFLFGKIKLVKGYVKPIKEGLCVHYSSKKALIIPYKSLINFKKSIEPVKDFNVIKANYLVEIGTKDYLTSTYYAYLLNYFNTFLESGLYINKPYLKTKSAINVYENKLFNVYLSTIILFNPLMIVLSIVKTIWRYLFERKNRKKQN